MCQLKMIAVILLIIGGLNWGLYGLFHFDLVARLFGEFTSLSRCVYGLVGLAAVFKIFYWLQCKACCNAK